MKILVINSGSSSLKYKLINIINKKVICHGNIERIFIKNETIFSYFVNNKKVIYEKNSNITDYESALKYLIKILLDNNIGVIKNIQEIDVIGHRVVHGGKYFAKPVLINSDVCEKIKELESLAPLHNHANLLGIKSCQKIFGSEIKQYAVFDTSYYLDLPDYVYTYSVPYEYYEKYNIRKYGFHGISHKYVIEKYCEISKKNINNTKIISCHLGNGSSITAVKNGKVVETSMGISPLGGVIMGTRSGSLDPAIIFQIIKKEKNLDKIEKLEEIFYKSSGLKSISGISSDDRDITIQENLGNKRAILAHKIMIHQIIKYIGGYISVMNGCDAIIFTGGIGENQPVHRERICESFEYLNLKINKNINNNIINSETGVKISFDSSNIDVYVISTNEELAIAQEISNIL